MIYKWLNWYCICESEAFCQLSSWVKVLGFGGLEELHGLCFQRLRVYIESDFSWLIAWIGTEHKWDGWAYQAPGLLRRECNFEPANWPGANNFVSWFQRLGDQVFYPNQDCSWSYQHPAKSLPRAASCCNPFQPTTCFWNFLDSKTLAQNSLVLAGPTHQARSQQSHAPLAAWIICFFPCAIACLLFSCLGFAYWSSSCTVFQGT